MIAVDTYILVYAHRPDMEFHKRADRYLTDILESGLPIAIPYPCISEFLSIVTNQKIFKNPTPAEIALKELDGVLDFSNIYLIGELNGFYSLFNKLILNAKIKGGAIHDARIATICLQHEISELHTADRDFNRFKGLKTKNPLI